MKKILALAALTALLLTTLNGCADVDGEPDDKSISSNSSAVVGENNLPDEQNNFPSKCRILKQTAKTFTEEQLLSFFSETPARTYYSERNMAEYASETERGYTSATDLRFFTDAGVLCMMAYGGTYGEGIYTNNDTLDFASQDEVLEKINSIMENFGFSPSDWFVSKSFSVKSELLEQFKEKTYKQLTESLDENPYSLDESEIEEQINQAEKIKQRPSKDFYYIDIRFKIDEIPIYPEGVLYRGVGNTISSGLCQICYSKDGIEYISIGNVFVTESSEYVEIMEQDKARELIAKKYNEIIFEGEVEVNDMKLVYIPIPQNEPGDYGNKFETRPFYAFYCKITEKIDGENLVTNNITYFDAVSGEEFAAEKLSSYNS